MRSQKYENLFILHEYACAVVAGERGDTGAEEGTARAVRECVKVASHAQSFIPPANSLNGSNGGNGMEAAYTGQRRCKWRQTQRKLMV